MGVEPKIGGCLPPKMDGENNGKPNPMNKWMIWGVTVTLPHPYFWLEGHPYVTCQSEKKRRPLDLDPQIPQGLGFYRNFQDLMTPSSADIR